MWICIKAMERCWGCSMLSDHIADSICWTILIALSRDFEECVSLYEFVTDSASTTMIHSQVISHDRFNTVVALFKTSGLIRTTAGIHEQNTFGDSYNKHITRLRTISYCVCQKYPNFIFIFAASDSFSASVLLCYRIHFNLNWFWLNCSPNDTNGRFSVGRIAVITLSK